VRLCPLHSVVSSGLTLRNTQRSVSLRAPHLRAFTGRVLVDLRLGEYALDVWCTTDATLKRLNSQYREKHTTTDILSFPFQVLHPPPSASLAHPLSSRALPPSVYGALDLGQLVISMPYVQRSAKALDVTVESRMRTLIVHGVCHLLGYDHENDAEAEVMEREEDRLMAAVAAQITAASAAKKES
jgi:probable rRNA maturation factor